MTYQAASERLADLGREFYRRGWALGTSGNFSAVIDREPLHLAITASSVDKGRLTADQILEVDSTGHVLKPGQGKPSAETLLHLAVVGCGSLKTARTWRRSRRRPRFCCEKIQTFMAS